MKNQKLIDLEKTLRIAKLIRDGDEVNATQIAELSTSLNSLSDSFTAYTEGHHEEHESIDSQIRDLQTDIAELVSLIDGALESDLTEDDVMALIESMRPEKPDVVVKDGYTPQKGIDYFDGLPGKDADEDSILERLLTYLPTPQVIEILTGEQIVTRINESEGIIDKERVEGLQALEERVAGIKPGFTLFGGSSSAEETLGKTFEAVSKNLNSYPYTLAYTGDDLTTITYTTPRGNIVKTLGYTSGNLTSITLSGALQNPTPNTKTLSYTGDDLTGVSYS